MLLFVQPITPEPLIKVWQLALQANAKGFKVIIVWRINGLAA